ncbi:MAG: 4Fe-4S binding protein [Endomicrobia bacterium]|nr:4Fe-4S binding protein [Endomicrobiia bacterium]
MKRQIIKIDEAKCNGCGLCVSACHEGAIGIVNGKAKLLRDDYCDGLGNCLPACPVNAITFEEREAAAYNEEEVKKNMENKKTAEKVHGGCAGSMPKDLHEQEETLACGCPGSHSRSLKTEENAKPKKESEAFSSLRQWPVQIKLVPVNAPYFDNADLLIAADCSAFACGNFHDYMKGKITIIGCPKLDSVDYTEKFAAILENNNIKSLTVVRMEVPCCGGLAHAALEAARQSGKDIKTETIVLGINGKKI